MAAVGVALAVVALIAANRVAMPELVGLDHASALEEMDEVGLSLDDDQINWDSSVERTFQVVATQNPSAGDTVWRTVEVQLRMEPMRVTVADVRDLTLNQARQVLGELGLGIQTEFGDDPVATTWQVLAQSLWPGSNASAGDSIELELDVPEVAVPQLVGSALGDATSALQLLGFTIAPDIAEAESDWEVMSQSVPAGEARRYGGAVEVAVLPPLVEVPNVAGLGLWEAESALEGAGFTVTLRPEDGASDWTVQTQSPAGGAQARDGSAVTLTLREPRIVFSVSGNGTRALITWAVPGGSFSIGQENNASLPWSKSFPMTSGYKGNLSAQMLNGSSITCTITVNGRVTSQITSTGQYSIASCG
ncbi:MAG: MmpS family transport accessory protein [Microcella pacifica]|uniref:PASTA domain-containing protein n=1 Tax=Microcella pacifica TaxID=2591847 RepID=A0A9E5JMF0_9MICO|nr:MmpS family transport accessory protein [Microcella pacifica]NHF63295.1 PASTA domain-containing protein [Microcella pacifica]